MCIGTSMKVVISKFKVKRKIVPVGLSHGIKTIIDDFVSLRFCQEDIQKNIVQKNQDRCVRCTKRNT